MKIKLAERKTLKNINEAEEKALRNQVAVLQSRNRSLLAVCEVVAKRLANMTSEKFALGMDRPLRDMLAEAIRKNQS